jgi:hypothetical protein
MKFLLLFLSLFCVAQSFGQDEKSVGERVYLPETFGTIHAVGPIDPSRYELTFSVYCVYHVGSILTNTRSCGQEEVRAQFLKSQGNAWSFKVGAFDFKTSRPHSHRSRKPIYHVSVKLEGLEGHALIIKEFEANRAWSGDYRELAKFFKTYASDLTLFHLPETQLYFHFNHGGSALKQVQDCIHYSDSEFLMGKVEALPKNHGLFELRSSVHLKASSNDQNESERLLIGKTSTLKSGLPKHHNFSPLSFSLSSYSRQKGWTHFYKKDFPVSAEKFEIPGGEIRFLVTPDWFEMMGCHQ